MAEKVLVEKVLKQLKKEKTEKSLKDFCKSCKETHSQQQFLTEGQPNGSWKKKEFDEKFCENCKLCSCGHPKVWHYKALDSCQGNEDSCPCTRYTPLKEGETTEWDGLTNWEKRAVELALRLSQAETVDKICKIQNEIWTTGWQTHLTYNEKQQMHILEELKKRLLAKAKAVNK